ncbi:MAG: T9SS type A sorting domain-containing protein [Bacteroidota bacterium]
MKKVLRLSIVCLILNVVSINTFAQQSLIYYWHFNNLVNFTTVQVSPSTFPVIRPNYTTLDSTKAFIKYAPLTGTVGNQLTFYDNTSPGDILNARFGTPAGLGLRPRNPSDSMQLMFYIPSTSYKNITIKYETQKSSAGNGGATDSMDYSVDSGVTWVNSGISPLVASNGTGAWSTSVLYAAISDPLAFNNSKLVFRIRFNAPGNTGTSGNVRVDNVTVEGDSIQAPKLMYYWHFNNLVNFTSVQVSPSIFPIIRPNYTTLDSTKAFIKFAPLAGTVGNQLTFYDNTTGDTVNARLGQPAGTCLRPRNPTDSMQLMVYIPSTGYKNFIIKFETQKSSAGNGGATDSMDYSLDSGVTWTNSGITPLVASNGTGAWMSPGSPITATINDLRAWNNSKLVFRIRFNAPGNTGTSGNVRVDNLTIEGDTFTGTYPLPVKMLSFNAHIISDRNIIVSWQTASEIDNDHFILERSYDEKNWGEIGNIKGVGNSNNMNAYQYEDQLENNYPVVYYRLKQFDVNGTFTISNSITVTFKDNLPNVISIENPVKDNICKINITSANQSTLNIIVSNTFGMELIHTPQNVNEGKNNINIDMNSLSSGLYFIEIKDKTTTLAIKKIVK